MPIAPDKACEICGKPSTDGYRCADHKNDAKRDYDKHRAKNDEYYQFLHSPAWRKLSESFRGLNSSCQLIVDGQQCGHAAYAVHHISDGRTDIANRTNWKNLAALCKRCHDHREGDDTATPHAYAPTNMPRWLGGGTYSHNESTPAPVVQAAPAAPSNNGWRGADVEAEGLPADWKKKRR